MKFPENVNNGIKTRATGFGSDAYHYLDPGNVKVFLLFHENIGGAGSWRMHMPLLPWIIGKFQMC